MHWTTGIQRALDYLEEHITEDISYETLARMAYSSPYHFQRIFSLLCGHTLGDYIVCAGSPWPAKSWQQEG